MLDTVATFAPLEEPVGEIAGLAASLVSGILGLSTNKGPDPMNVILQEIKTMFEQYHRPEIMEKINGTFEVWRQAHVTMNGLEESGKFTKDDFTTLQTIVRHSWCWLLGASCIFHEKVDDAKNLLEIVRSYCQLSLFRLILLYQKYSLCMKMKQEEGALATKENID